ncbi:polysaccharide deacetylase family protein [Streptacidiphilus sp. NEAU-YB345]|uniref:Polysaccharide deacetylase family protein n=1 Tax=Streptacidiphilus fuscans TaxID=2789292 RepID=A0A931B2X5_9ACTN|nr:polysaccharide deacetylase family protein [Streptacidiphilus fuscans]
MLRPVTVSPLSSPSSLTRRRLLGGAVSLAALGSFATACGGSSASPSSDAASASTAPSASPSLATGSSVDAELIARRYPGLKPFAPAPPPPAVKPITLSLAHPQVFSRVPITEKVVFVTIDDGLEKDPAFIQMVKDFQVPLTVSLADTLIMDDYKYFAELHATGFVSIQNHTLTHPLDMPRLSAERQLAEIAGQQEKLRKEYGVAPYLFRPPGGNYDSATVAAARQAGLRGMMLWKESMEIHDMQYQTADHRLRPGDIILCHFRGPAQLKGETMVQMMANLYRHIQAQGFTVADVTDYV